MIYTETEIYNLDGDKQELPGFDNEYHNIVDYILKITEEIWEERKIWVIYDTYAQDILIHTGAEVLTGVDGVITGTIKKLSSFPDRKMIGEAVIWSKENKNSLHSSHRIFSTATNRGDTEFGPSTGKKVKFRTIADCMVSENKIYEEWLVRDNLYLIEQLGFDPVEQAKKDTRYDGKEIKLPSLTSQKPIHTSTESDASKLLLDLFKSVWEVKDFSQLGNFYAEDAVTHAICDEDLLGASTLQGYLEKLSASFPDAQIEVERISCNQTKDGHEIAVRWKIFGYHTGVGFFGQPTQRPVVMPVISHYNIKEGKIVEEWMVFDAFDTLCQIHASKALKSTNVQNKETIAAFVKDMNKAVAGRMEVSSILDQYMDKEVLLNVSKPFDEMKGVAFSYTEFWKPLLHSFPDLEDQPYILLGGEYGEADRVCVAGNMIGTFKEDWLGIPSNNQPIWLRYTAHFILENNKITKAWYFFDVLDIMRQAGYNFFPNKGVEWVPPAPMTGDGVMTTQQNGVEGQKTFDLTNAMIEGLLEYDGNTLDSMAQERFWDTENMMWYGPSSIGTTKGLKGFQNNHQIPFLKAFPNRGVIAKENIDMAQLAEGNYSCHAGFPIMNGSHTGDGWLGLKATNKPFTMRLMDFWRREDGKLKENWVMIDMIDLLEQFGINVFDLLHEKKRSNGQD